MPISPHDLARLGLVYPRDAIICDLSTPCDLYSGSKRPSKSGHVQREHRISYANHRGVQVESLKGSGIVIRHLCHVPNCRNPLHLAAGSYKDNFDDSVLSWKAGGRSFAKFCPWEPRVTKEQVAAAKAHAREFFARMNVPTRKTRRKKA